MKTDSPEWIIAKASGDRAELAVAEWFRTRGYQSFKALGLADFDLLLQCGVEVKHDLKAEETGNVAIEVSYRTQPSGIMTSGANFWALVVANEAMIVKTEALREFVLRGAFRTVPAGDGQLARVRLVPWNELRVLKGTTVIPLPELKA